MVPRAYMVHRLKNRIRLKVPDKRKDIEWLAETASQMEQLPGVEQVEIGLTTGSMLIHCEDCRHLEELLAKGNLIELVTGPVPAQPALEPVARAGSQFDQQLEHLTRGGVNLRTVLFLVLVALAIAQIVRGQVMVPAISLLWWAMELALGNVGHSASKSSDASPSE